MTKISKGSIPRQIASVVFAIVFLALTTAAEYPDRGQPSDSAYLERMVLTIGLGATLALMFAGITGWLIKTTMRQAEEREIRLMAEIREARESANRACPLAVRTSDPLNREHHHEAQPGRTP